MKYQLSRLLAFLIAGAMLGGWTPAAFAQVTPAPREATAAQATAGTAGNVYISPRRLSGNDVVLGDTTFTGDDIFGVLGLNVTASQTTNKNLTLASSGTTGNIVFKSGSTTQGTFIGGGGLLMAGATGGNPSLGVINAAGLKINGVDVSTSSDTYWTAVTGGIGYGSKVVIGVDPGGTENLRVGGSLRLQSVALTNSSDTLVVGNNLSTGAGTFSGAIAATGTVTTPDVLLGTSGPSVKSSLAAKAPSQGVVFDGTASLSANIGTVGSSPLTVGVKATIPASGTNIILTVGASATNPAQPKAFTIYTLGTSLFVQLNAAVGSYLLGEVTGFVTAYANKVVDIVAVRNTSGVVALYVNGIATSPTFTSSGTPPANWQAAIDGPYFLLGPATAAPYFVGTMTRPLVYNRALSAAEVLALYESGASAVTDLGVAGSVPPSNTALVGEAFANYQYDTFSGASATGFTAVETGGQTCQSTTRKTTGTYMGLAPVGTKFLVTFTATLTSGAAPVAFIDKSGSGTASNAVTVTAGANSILFTLTLPLTAELSTGCGGFAFTTTGNTSYAISGVNVTRLGLLLAPDATQAGAGTSWRDTSGNAAHITIPATGVSWALPSSGYSGGALLAKSLSAFGGVTTVTANSTFADYYSNGSRFGAFGPDTSTNATLALQSYRSDGSNPLNLLTFTAAGNATLVGNLTVSGTGTHAFSGPITATTSGALLGTFQRSGSSGGLQVYADDSGPILYPTDNADYIQLNTGGSPSLTITAAKATTVAGNLTVSGTGTHIFAGPIRWTVGTGTNAVYNEMVNTGGTAYYGIANSAGSSFFTGGSAYAFTLQAPAGKKVEIGAGNIIGLTVDAAGAATNVAGSLTASGTVTGRGTISTNAATFIDKDGTEQVSVTGYGVLVAKNSINSGASGTPLAFYTGATKVVDMAVGGPTVYGNLTVSGTGTSTFAGDLTLQKKTGLAATILTIDRYSDGIGGGTTLQTATTNDWFVGLRGTVDSDYHVYSYGTSADAFKLARATGAATFAGTLTASNTGAHTFGTTNTITIQAGNITAAGSSNLAPTGVVISTSGALSSVAPGTSGNVLTSNGTTWASTAPVSSNFAEIYVTDGSAAQSIPTGATYTKLTGFTTDGVESVSNADVANDKITFTVAGTYRISWGMSITADTNNVIWNVVPFVNGVEAGNGEASRKVGTGADVGDFGRTCIVTVGSVPVDLDLRAKHNAVGSVLITPVQMNLNVNKIN